MARRTKEGQQRLREAIKRRSRERHEQAAEIGSIPPVGNAKRRESCKKDLLRFLVTYFPATTGKNPLSPDHERMISRIQSCILDGGLFCNAFPRGFAKTTITENSALWATLYGHRKFVPIFGANADSAAGNIDSIKLELAENDLLLEDFPEVCFPIRALEGKPQRCASQTCQGRQTHIEWRSAEIVLPTIEGSAASGAIIIARGLKAAGRGMKHKRPDGTQQRPDFVLIDDPQTDESARTELQCDRLLSVIRRSILKLGGHDRKIACVMNATVIRAGDVVEQILDPKKFPAWQGERVKMVRKWADAHETLWLRDYQRLRNTYDPLVLGDQQRAHREATEFYRRNRAKMDAGCEVSWQYCFDQAVEISAIQHAYNCLIDDGEEVFASECQNEPLAEKLDDDDLTLTSDFIASKLNRLPRGALPAEASRVVAFLDPKKELIYWEAVAFADDFTGWVVDYGAWPDQKRSYYSSRRVRFSLQKSAKGKSDSWEAALFAGLDALVGELAGREWKREDGASLKIERCGIDANWGPATDTIYEFCRASPHAVILLPTHGRYVGAAARPFSDWRPKPGDRSGLNWRMPAVNNRRSVRYLLFDSNSWKTFTVNRLQTPLGGRGCLSIFGDEPKDHKLFADHHVAEAPVAVEAKGRRIIEWRQKPNVDNDFFDCTVGCHVVASERGVSLHARKTQPRKVVRLSELQKRAKHWSPRNA